MKYVKIEIISDSKKDLETIIYELLNKKLSNIANM